MLCSCNKTFHSSSRATTSSQATTYSPHFLFQCPLLLSESISFLSLIIATNWINGRFFYWSLANRWCQWEWWCNPILFAQRAGVQFSGWACAPWWVSKAVSNKVNHFFDPLTVLLIRAIALAAFPFEVSPLAFNHQEDEPEPHRELNNATKLWKPRADARFSTTNECDKCIRIDPDGITEDDVMCGKKHRGSKHPGNIHFRCTIAMFKPKYRSLGSHHQLRPWWALRYWKKWSKVHSSGRITKDTTCWPN